MAITTDRYLRGLKRRITLPANQALMTTSDFLEIGDDIMKDRMIPLMMSVNENFFVAEPVDVTMVVNQAAYPMPARSIGVGLRDAKFSRDGTDTALIDLAQIALEDEHLYQRSGQPSGFYFRGDQFILVPAPQTTSQFVRYWYNLQPSLLVQAQDAAQVTAIGATTITCSSVPTTMTAGVTIDFIQETGAGRVLGLDKSIVSVSGNDITFASADIPAVLSVGDYIALAQQSPVIQLPEECYPLFETAACERILYAIGDYDGSAKLREDGQIQEVNLKKIISPRIEGESKKIVNRNGLLRGRGFNYWRVRGGFYQ